MTTRSWVDVPAGSPFPLANLPYGLARRGDQDAHAVMAVGEHAVDLHAAACRSTACSPTAMTAWASWSPRRASP